MSKFRFTASSVVVEASSEEDAISKIAARMSVVARHLGNEQSMGDTGAFFTIAKVGDETTVTDFSDPLTSEDDPAYETDEPDMTPASEAAPDTGE